MTEPPVDKRCKGIFGRRCLVLGAHGKNPNAQERCDILGRSEKIRSEKKMHSHILHHLTQKGKRIEVENIHPAFLS